MNDEFDAPQGGIPKDLPSVTPVSDTPNTEAPQRSVTPDDVTPKRDAGHSDTPPVLMSPADEARAALVKNMRREGRDGRPADGLDPTTALFGYGHKPMNADDAAEALDKAEHQQAQPQSFQGTQDGPAAPAPQAAPSNDNRIHGNKNVQLVVRDKVYEMPMAEVRRMLTTNGIEHEGQPDTAVIATARMLMAGRTYLDEAKQTVGRVPPGQEAQQPAPQAAPQAPQPQQPQIQEDPDEAFLDAVNELQFGDQATAAQKLRNLIKQEAATLSQQTVQYDHQTRYVQTAAAEVGSVMAEYEAKPEFQAIAHIPVVKDTLRGWANHIVTESLKQHVGEDDPRLRNDVERGNLFRELRSQGLGLPSEGQITRAAYDLTLRQFGGPQRAVQQNTATQPAVQMSPARQERPAQASPQPRVSSATLPTATRRDVSAIIADARRNRGQVVA